MNRFTKFYWDYRTHRDLHGGSVWQAVRFAWSNPQFPKREDFKRENF